MASLPQMIDSYLAGGPTLRQAVAGMSREQLLARPQPPDPLQEFQAIIGEFEKRAEESRNLLDQAKTDEERRQLLLGHHFDLSPIAARMVQLARKYPGERAALGALLWVVDVGHETTEAGPALELLKQHHLTSKRLAEACPDAATPPRWPGPPARSRVRAPASRASRRRTRADR